MGDRGKSVVAGLLGLTSLVLVWAQLSRSVAAITLLPIAVAVFPGLLVVLSGRLRSGIVLGAVLVAATFLWGAEGMAPFVVGIVLVPLVVVSFMHAAEFES